MAKNSEVYTTAQERAEAFARFAMNTSVVDIQYACYLFEWLEKECEDEKPLPCPFCGSKCEASISGLDCWYVNCTNDIRICSYHSARRLSRYEAIAAHNRVANAVKESEANNG